MSLEIDFRFLIEMDQRFLINFAKKNEIKCKGGCEMLIKPMVSVL